MSLISKWWVWVCCLVAFIFLCISIVSIILGTHTYKFEFYANDQMVDVSKIALRTASNTAFNECVSKCENIICVKACEGYYNSSDIYCPTIPRCVVNASGCENVTTTNINEMI